MTCFVTFYATQIESNISQAKSSPMPFLLDLIIHNGTIENPPPSERLIWIMLKMDGVEKPFKTGQVESSSSPNFNFPLRVVLSLNSVESAHMMINFCTHSDDNTQIVSFAVAKLGLGNFPRGRPRKFTFPLMSTSNTAIKVGSLSMTATISAFVTINSTNAPQGNGNMNPQMTLGLPAHSHMAQFSNFNSYPNHFGTH